ERDITELRSRPAVWIGRRQYVVAAVAAHPQNDERRIHERLEAEIAVHVLGERTIVGNVSGLRVKAQIGLGPRTALAGQPLFERGQKGPGRSGHTKPLVHGFEPVWNVVPEELAHEWALDIAGGFAPEKICCIDRSQSGCPQVSNGR